MRPALSILFLVAGSAMAMGQAMERPAFVAPDADNSAQLLVDVTARQPDGSTALHWAVYGGDLATVQRLLAAAGARTAAAIDPPICAIGPSRPTEAPAPNEIAVPMVFKNIQRRFTYPRSRWSISRKRGKP